MLRADGGRIAIGRESSLQYHSTIYGTGGVEIGDGTRISAHVLILATVHIHDDPTQPIVRQGITGKGIQIGSDVWIGAGSVILDGTTVGSHSIIGAGSVVTKDVPESCLVVGNPAHVVRSSRNRRYE
jgi:acetyltransferase-like isoleucine patch superfamily enzyme